LSWRANLGERCESKEKFASARPRALPNPHRTRLVESQDLAGAQREHHFGIDNFLSIQLHTTLLDQAAGFSARFRNREWSRVSSDDDCHCVLITRRKFGKLGVSETLFAEARVPFVQCFFRNGGGVISLDNVKCV